MKRCGYCFAPHSRPRSDYCCDDHAEASAKHPTIGPLTRAEANAFLANLKRKRAS